jgi:hypothetical protein
VNDVWSPRAVQTPQGQLCARLRRRAAIGPRQSDQSHGRINPLAEVRRRLRPDAVGDADAMSGVRKVLSEHPRDLEQAATERLGHEQNARAILGTSPPIS